jgi:O-antigen/teichoic acid export membrane protein
MQVKEKASHYLAISIVQTLINASLVVLYLLFYKEGVIGVLKAQLYGNLILAPFFIYYNLKIVKFKLNYGVIRQSLVYSLPIVPLIASSWILNMSDRVFIEKYFSLTEIGIYGIGQRLSSLIIVICGAFGTAYSPIFYKLAGSKEQNTAKEQLTRINNIYMYFVLLLSFMLALFSREVIIIFLNPNYYESYKIVQILICAYAINGLGGLFNFSIYQELNTKPVMILFIVSAMVSITLNFILVPQYGIYGAGVTALISYTILFISTYMYTKKCYYIPVKWTKILPLATVLFLSTLLFNYLNTGLYLNIIIKSIATIGIVSLVLFMEWSNVKTISNCGNLQRGRN